MSAYLFNLVSLARGNSLLRPLAAVFHLTGQCNLNCAYCEDYGARRTSNALADLGTLSLAEAERVLAVLRQATPNLIFTGGEPLLYPHFASLLERAGSVYRFKHLTLLTNGLLLGQNLDLLPHLNRLVISLDSLNAERWGRLIGLNARAAQTIHNVLVAVAAQQHNGGPPVVINCVITPETLPDVPEVLEFCREHHLAFAFSAQSFNNWPHYGLLSADSYRALVDDIIRRKKAGQKILGSMAYLNLARNFQPYRCYPSLIPRVLPNGDLVYPCRPIERSGTAHGGRPANLTRVASWREALAQAEAQFGSPPTSCASCFQQCYAEPSLLQARPLTLLSEYARFGPSRRLNLLTFAPG